MERVIKFLFYFWILTLLVFSGFSGYGVFFHPEWEQQATNIMLVDVVAGIIAFLGFWGLGFIALFLKEHRQPAVNILGRSILITFTWGVLFALLIFSQVNNKPPVIAKGPMSEVGQVILSPSPTPSQTPTPKPIDPYANDPDLKNAEWGEAIQVREHEYKMKVGQDPAMATPQEIYEAVNNYRSTKGVSRLEWNEKIAALARERVLEIATETTPHEGLQRRMSQDGFWDEYQINGAGENASFGYRLSGVHLIEWMYASDSGHESNQLNPRWNCVGIGVSGNTSVLIFCNK